LIFDREAFQATSTPVEDKEQHGNEELE